MTSRPGAPDPTRPRRDGLPRTLHGAVALCATVGVGIEVARALGADDGSGAERLVRLLSYFTIWTNLLVAAVSTRLAVAPRHDGRAFRALRLDSVLFVVVTAVTSHLVLRDYLRPDLAGRVADVLTHSVVPAATVVVWWLAGPRPRITWGTCLAALGLPAVWLAWTFAHGAATGWYPYPFLDATRLGTARAVVGALAILLVGVLLGVLLRAVDRVLPSAPR